MLNVQQLIEKLQKIEDKSMVVNVCIDYIDPIEGQIWPEGLVGGVELVTASDETKVCKIVPSDWNPLGDKHVTL